MRSNVFRIKKKLSSKPQKLIHISLVGFSISCSLRFVSSNCLQLYTTYSCITLRHRGILCGPISEGYESRTIPNDLKDEHESRRNQQVYSASPVKTVDKHNDSGIQQFNLIPLFASHSFMTTYIFHFLWNHKNPSFFHCSFFLFLFIINIILMVEKRNFAFRMIFVLAILHLVGLMV